VGDAGLEQEVDGSFTGPSLHYDEIINMFSKLGIISQTEIFERFLSRLLNYSNIESVSLPSTLRPEIQVREYQLAGYHWLVFIKNYGLPGILADEMGLGKTLQSLLVVAHLKDVYGRCPSLVVCPAALVNKWFDETAKFFTGVRPLVYWGPRRQDQLRENIGTADIVITTYQTLRSDAEYLARWKWRFLIADEAQRLKNPGIQLVKSIKRIPAEARIAITGTPVENKVRDLWSLFDFLAHGYFGSLSSFESVFSNPIEKWGDKGALEKLLKRTKPFVLRRLKKSVAKELPDKIYKHMRCELSSLQRQLYKAVIDRDLKAAIEAVGGKPLSLGNPHIFAVLTRLKQICCHPGLVTGDFQPYKSGVSGKFDAFTEILEEILEENSKEGTPNKLVGISQYVGMTGYLHDYVKSQGKECSLIDGKVAPQIRPEICNAFNSHPNQFGMMLSLMAGGVGLDLPGANHVVLYDRWWNPAVEDQAIDRAHRIGQNREVIVFTITAKGTLEEKIEQKLAQKRDIFDLVIRPDELLRKEITRDELMELVKLEE
jgi:SNF2 family DNA or RNA helicase